MFNFIPIIYNFIDTFVDFAKLNNLSGKADGVGPSYVQTPDLDIYQTTTNNS